MLSRLTLKAANAISAAARPGVRVMNVHVEAKTDETEKPEFDIPKVPETIAAVPPDTAERDLRNFPRLKRPEFPGKVRMGFVPEEWFQMMYNKTGVTGPYVFGVGLATFLVSKEIYVLEHEFYSGVSLFIMVVYAIKKFGPPTAAYLDKEVDKEEAELKKFRTDHIEYFEKAVAEEEHAQWQAKEQKIHFVAKRENVHLQLEAAFRERQLMVYNEVKKRLDYKLATINTELRIKQKHMVEWIVANVLKSITEDQEKDALKKCIFDLKQMAPK